MSEPQKLLYKQNLLNVECDFTDSCRCALCDGCRFVINTTNHLLAICCENDLKEHYNYLAANLDGLFAAAAEKLGEQRYIQ